MKHWKNKHRNRESNPGILDSLKSMATGKNALYLALALGVGAYLWGRSRGRKEESSKLRQLQARLAQVRQPVGPLMQQQQGVPMAGMASMGVVGGGMGGFENLGDLADGPSMTGLACGDTPCASCSGKAAPVDPAQALQGIGDELDYMS